MGEIAKTTNGEIAQPHQTQKNKAISAALAKLSIAYPAQTRSFSDEDVRLLSLVWHEAFEDVEADVLGEAVRRFIKRDRAGFFPSPGQIMGHAEEIAEENRQEEAYAEARRQAAKMREIDALRANGGDYTACVHSERFEVVGGPVRYRCTCPAKREVREHCIGIDGAYCLNYAGEGG